MYLRNYTKGPDKKRRSSSPAKTAREFGVKAVKFVKVSQWLLRCATMVILVWASFVLLRYLVYKTDYFKIGDVVVSGVEDASIRRQIILQSGLVPREFVFSLDLDLARNKILADPLVKEARVYKDVSNDLRIEVSMRKGHLLLKDGSQFMVVDDQSRIIRTGDRLTRDEMELPLVTGIDVSDGKLGDIVKCPKASVAIDWLKSIPGGVVEKLAEIFVRAPSEVWLVYENGDRIKGDRPSTFLARFGELESLRRYLEKNVIKTEYIDIRYDIGYVVKRF